MKTYVVLKSFLGKTAGQEIELDDDEASSFVAAGKIQVKSAKGVAEATTEIEATADRLADLVLTKTMQKLDEASKGASPLTMPAKNHAEAKDHGSMDEWLWALAGHAQTMEPSKQKHCKDLLINKYECKINPEFGQQWQSANKANGTDAVSKASVQVENVGSLGGLTVPPQYSAEFFRLAAPQSIFMNRVKRYTMTGKQLMIPALDYTTGAAGVSPYLGGMNAVWTGENIGFTQQNMQVRQIELNANLLAGYTQSSRTLLADSPVALAQVMTGLFAQAIAFNVDLAIFKGTGVNQPKGMTISSACKTFTRGAWGTNGLLLVDLARADSYLIPELEGGAIWLMPPSMKPNLYPMTDASGKVVFLPNFPNGGNDGPAQVTPKMAVFGKPVFFSQLAGASALSTGTAGDVSLLIPSLYALGLREDIEIAVSEHFAFTTNLLTWRFLFRGGGESLLNTTLTLQNADVVAPFVQIT